MKPAAVYQIDIEGDRQAIGNLEEYLLGAICVG
jgi:hypothetical protein